MTDISQPIVRKVSNMKDIKEKLIDEAKRIVEDSLYSAKGHFAAAGRWTNCHLWMGIPTAFLAAIASASALSQFDNHNIVAAFLAIIVTALTAVMTFLNPSEKAYSHRNAGNRYLSLRNTARIFFEIDCTQEKSDEELTKQLKELSKLLNELNQNSPLIPPWAYEKAKKDIEKGATDYEIDKKKKNTARGQQ